MAKWRWWHGWAGWHANCNHHMRGSLHGSIPTPSSIPCCLPCLACLLAFLQYILFRPMPRPPASIFRACDMEFLAVHSIAELRPHLTSHDILPTLLHAYQVLCHASSSSVRVALCFFCAFSLTPSHHRSATFSGSSPGHHEMR